MKYLALFIFYFNLSFSQDIGIEIPNQVVVELPFHESTSVCYNIKNNSDNYYKFLFDSTGFNTAEDEYIDPLYLGLADFRVFSEDVLLVPIQGSDAYEKEPLSKKSPSKEELLLFKKKNNLKFSDIEDLRISYAINKRIITLAPKEVKSVCSVISLPIYNSLADGGSLFYDIKDGKEYHFQLHVNVPKDMLKKYYSPFYEVSKKYKVFSGTLVSNKVAFISREKK